ncbi:MAG TPA: MvaI/BcnI family restriction endonuclease [Cyclobacteriaceae bacterium]|nr:MvaI/BcnI family restriction endonuclease [Cyclobacteriaceae bacterium]
MRQLTSVEEDRIRILTEHLVDFTLIEPTKTGLEKSIMDATGPVRSYLKAKEIHDYEYQKQGPDNKIQVPAYFIEDYRQIASVASLYRPLTKNGDPRIWFTRLASHAKPNDVLAIIAFEEEIYVINITSSDVSHFMSQADANPLKEFVARVRDNESRVSRKLLFLLKQLASRGPIPALLNADTAVGRTLEAVLGIPINSSKNPDYYGIELKSFRAKQSNRKNLFAQVPNWELSKFKSSAEILEHFGYRRSEDFKLYCTVSTLRSNSQGLRLKVTKEATLIEQSDRAEIGAFATWPLKTLHARLLEKHNETFWISADPVWVDGIEHFLYKRVEHSRKPIISQFDILLERGIITMDHLIKKSAKSKVVEKGPLFKIKPDSIGLLFPPTKIYDL